MGVSCGCGHWGHCISDGDPKKWEPMNHNTSSFPRRGRISSYFRVCCLVFLDPLSAKIYLCPGHHQATPRIWFLFIPPGRDGPAPEGNPGSMVHPSAPGGVSNHVAVSM